MTRTVAADVGELVSFAGDPRDGRAAARLEGVLLRPQGSGAFPGRSSCCTAAPGLRTRDGGDPGQAPLLGGAPARSRLRGPPGGQLHHPRHRRGLHRPSPPLAGAGSRGRRARALRYLQGRGRREGGPVALLGWSNGAAADAQRGLRSGHHRAGLPSRRRLLPELHPEVSGRAGLPPLRAALRPDRRARRLDAGRPVHGDRRAGSRGRVARSRSRCTPAPTTASTRRRRRSATGPR